MFRIYKRAAIAKLECLLSQLYMQILSVALVELFQTSFSTNVPVGKTQAGFCYAAV